MKRICIVLNAFYPFNPGETFLANEIEYLSVFDKMYIIPIHGDIVKNRFSYKKCNNTNFSVWKLAAFDKKKKITFSFLTLFSKDFYAEIFELCKSRRLTKHNIFKALRFNAHALFCANCIEKKLKAEKIDVSRNKIFLYSYWMNLDAYVATILKRRIGKHVKMVTRGHRVDIYEYADESGYIPMRRPIFNSADILYPIADDGKNYLISNYGIDEEKIIVSRLGTYDRGINMPIKNGELQVVSCSWMRKVKRLDMLVDALGKINFPVHWTHFGDGDEMQNIKKLIEMRLKNNVRVSLRGAMPNDLVLQSYANDTFNVFVNVSSSEGVPVSIMEAMSFGIPIIATDVGGTREIVKNGSNGYLLPADFYIEQLVEALNCIYYINDADYCKMCEASRNIWCDRFNAKKNYEEFINSLIS